MFQTLLKKRLLYFLILGLNFNNLSLLANIYELRLTGSGGYDDAIFEIDLEDNQLGGLHSFLIRRLILIT